MSLMYRTWYDERIEPIEVVKRTSHFVTIKVSINGRDGAWLERRDKIDAAEMKYFETWLDAKNYLMTRTLGNIEKASNQLDTLRRDLQTIELMRKP